MALRAVAQHQCPGGGYVVALARGPGALEVAADCVVASVLGAGARGGSVEVLDLEALKPRRQLPTSATGLAVLPGGDGAGGAGPGLLTSGEDGSVKLWDIRADGAGPQRVLRAAGGGPAAAVAASVDGRLCAVAEGPRLRLLDVGIGRELLVHEDAHSEPVTCAAFRPRRGGPMELVSAADDGLVCALDIPRCLEGGKAVEDDAGLRLVMNGGESVQRLAFLGEDAAVVASISTTEVLQLWCLDERRAGADCGRFESLRSEPSLRVGETEGYLLDVLYDADDGRAHVLAGAVDGSLSLLHLNLQGARPVARAPPAAGRGAWGHRGVVRAAAQLGAALGDGLGGAGFVTGGEDGRLCVWAVGGERRDGGAPPAAAPGAVGEQAADRRKRDGCPWWKRMKEKKRARCEGGAA